MAEQSLVRASRPGGALGYARETMLSPLGLSGTAFFTCVGVGFAGLTGGLVALGGSIVAGALTSATGVARRQIDEVRRARAHKAMRTAHMKRLTECGPVRQQQYADIADLVVKIRQSDPSFEGEAILNDFVEMALEHQRCLDVLRMTGTNPIAVYGSDVRKQTMRQRMALRDELLKRIETLNERLEEVEEVLVLVAARAATPERSDDEATRRLEELLERERALAELP